MHIKYANQPRYIILYLNFWLKNNLNYSVSLLSDKNNIVVAQKIVTLLDIVINLQQTDFIDQCYYEKNAHNLHKTAK